MTEVKTASQALSALETTAKKLNKASDSMNKVLEAFEKRLIDSNVGLEVWMNDKPLAVTPGEEEGGWETSRTTDEVLGFAKVNDRWCLAVQRIVVVHGFFEGDSSSPYAEQHLDGEPIPLLGASRDLRLAALQVLPQLVEALDQRAQKAISSIENAGALLS